jgi:signal-transduction protein with cAMP-binding, CBS, and nucleotidyltransferase domain
MKLNHPAVFKDCDRDTMLGLVKRVSVQIYKPGEILLRKQSVCSSMMMIIEGHVISIP